MSRAKNVTGTKKNHPSKVFLSFEKLDVTGIFSQIRHGHFFDVTGIFSKNVTGTKKNVTGKKKNTGYDMKKNEKKNIKQLKSDVF